jgi:hypothetical protein
VETPPARFARVRAIERGTLRRMPWLARVLPWLLRHRWLVLIALSLLCAVIPQADPKPNDIDIYFASPALRLIRSGDLSVFTPTIQIGPVCLALLGIGAVLSSAIGLGATVGASVVTGLVALILTVAAIRALVPAGTPAAHRAAYELFGGVAVIWGAMPMATSYGHIEEMFIGLVLVLMAVEARRGHGARAGLWLAFAVTCKLWAGVAVVVLLLSPRWRTAVVATLTGAAGVVVAYAPFVLGGHFRTFDFRWTVQPHLPVTWLMPAGSPFDFRERIGQAALTCAVGGLVALRARRDVRAVWLVPATVVVTRLLVDPMLLPYYWTGFVACLVLALVFVDWPVTARAAAMLAVAGGLAGATLLLRAHPSRPLLALLTVVAVAFCVWCSRRRVPSGPEPTGPGPMSPPGGPAAVAAAAATLPGP